MTETGDWMTPKARMQALVSGAPYDRIPCIPSLSDHAALVLGVTVAEYTRSADLMIRGQIEAYRRYGHDAVGLGPGSTGIAEAAGSIVAFPEFNTPYVVDYVVKETSDLDRLVIPDPLTAGRFPQFLDALAGLVEALGDEVPIGLTLGGPVSTASNLRSAERFMRDIARDPDFAHRLLEYALAITVPFVREVARLPVGFTIVDPVSSGSLIGPAVYRDFAFPYQQRLIAAIIEASGRAPVLHVCGNTRRNWHLMADTGAGALSLELSAIGSRSRGISVPPKRCFSGHRRWWMRTSRNACARRGTARRGSFLRWDADCRSQRRLTISMRWLAPHGGMAGIRSIQDCSAGEVRRPARLRG